MLLEYFFQQSEVSIKIIAEYNYDYDVPWPKKTIAHFSRSDGTTCAHHEELKAWEISTV